MRDLRYDVTALGELLVDFTENGTSDQGNPLFEANPGGAPCNLLAMLSKLGRRTAFLGKVGDDALGHMLSSRVAAAGIDISALRYSADVHTTLAMVHTLPDGDRDFSFYRNPGADLMLQTDEVDMDKIACSRIFHFGTLSTTSEPAKSATYNAVMYAKRSGCLISFDPNLRLPLWSSEDAAKEQIAYGMSQCDILKISDNEIEFMTERKIFAAASHLYLSSGRSFGTGYYGARRQPSILSRQFNICAILLYAQYNRNNRRWRYLRWLCASLCIEIRPVRSRRSETCRDADVCQRRRGAGDHTTRRAQRYAEYGRNIISCERGTINTVKLCGDVAEDDVDKINRSNNGVMTAAEKTVG